MPASRRRLVAVLVAVLTLSCEGGPTAPLVQPPAAAEVSPAPTSGTVASLVVGSTWDGGAGNGLWNDPVNWSGDVLPAASANIEIPSGAGTVHVNAVVSIDATLILGASVVLEVDAGQTLTVNGQVTLDSFPAPAIVNRGTVTGPTTGSIIAGFNNEATGVVRNVRIETRSNGANRGTLDGMRLDFGNAGGFVFENFGTITSSTLRIRDPYLSVHPRLINRAGGSITGGSIEVGGPPNQSGYIDYGDLTNEGTITGAAMDVYETVTNTGTVDVSGGGRLSMKCDALYLRFGTLRNTGTVTGTLTADCLVWDGGGDGTSWSDPLNWNVDRAPGPDAVTPGVTFRNIFVVTSETSDVTVHLDVDQSFGFASRLDVRGRGSRTATLVVDAGKTLSITHSSALLVVDRGALTNQGTVTSVGDVIFGLYFSSVATATNNGTMLLQDQTYVRPNVVFRNNGALTNQGPFLVDGTLQNEGTLANSGSVEVSCSGSYSGAGTVSGTPLLFLCSKWDGGAANGLWNDPVNWTGDLLPSPTARVEIPNNAGTIHVNGPVTVNGTLTMGSSVVLEVDAGQTLTVGGQVTLSSFPAPAIVNRGTVTGPTTGSIIAGFNNEATGVVRNVRIETRSNGANRGTLDGMRLDFGNAGGFVFENFGTITSSTLRIRDPYLSVHPRLINRAGGSITGGSIEVGGPPNQSGYIDYGDLTNEGTITGAAMDVYETVTNTGTVDVSGGGRLSMKCDALYLRFGTLRNTGTVTGTLTADCLVWDGGGDGTSWSDPLNWNVDRAPGPDAVTPGVTFRNIFVVTSETSDVTVHLDVDQSFGFASRLDVRGRGSRTATLVVDAGKTLSITHSSALLVVDRGALTNQGTVTSVGDVIFGLYFSSVATATNNGTMLLQDQTYVRPSVVFRNNGSVVNTGTIENDGRIENACGATFTAGTIVGNAIVMAVCNTAPVPNAGGPYAVDEGGSVTLAGTATDLEGGPLTLTWDLDANGTFETGGASPVFSAAAIDGPASRTVVLKVCDSGSLCESQSTTVTVRNVAPIALAGGPYTVSAGSSVTLAGSATDVSADVLTLTWDLNNDGVFETAGAAPLLTAPNNPTTLTLTLRACDDDGACAAAVATVTVLMVPPVAAAGGPYVVNEGSSVTLAGGATNPGGGPLTFAWDLDANGTFETAGASPVFSAATLDGPASRSVALRVCDSGSLCDTKSATVTVQNVAPVALAGGPYAVNEGSSVALAGSATDVSADVLTLAWDLDGDGGFETTGATPSLAGLDGPSTLSPSLRACDDDGACVTALASVTVQNVAPVAHAGGDLQLFRNQAFSVAGTWTDPAGALDQPYHWSWDLNGDGTPDASGDAPYGATANAGGSIATEGVYTARFAVSDADGASGASTLRIEVRNREPVCTAAAPSVASIWPPNNKFVDVAIGGVADADGDPIALLVTSIRQDEALEGSADASIKPGGAGVLLRAKRLGQGNGRFYHIGFRATDGHGGACTGAVKVVVPHDQGKTPVDGGPLFDSTKP